MELPLIPLPLLPFGLLIYLSNDVQMRSLNFLDDGQFVLGDVAFGYFFNFNFYNLYFFSNKNQGNWM